MTFLLWVREKWRIIGTKALKSEKSIRKTQTTTNILCQSSRISLLQTTNEAQTQTKRALQETKTLIPFDMEVRGTKTYHSYCRLHLSGWLSRGAPRRPLFPTIVVYSPALPPIRITLSPQGTLRPPSLQIN